jgi:hypothetical protein
LINIKKVSALPTIVEVYDFYEGSEDVFSPEEYLAFFEKNNVGLFDLRQNFFHPVVAEPPQQELCNIDREAFCATFFFLCAIYGSRGRKEYFFLLHLAYFLERGRRCENLKCLFVHMHRSVTTKITRRGQERTRNQRITLFQDFPQQILFLPCLREPMQSADSFIALTLLAKETLSASKIPLPAHSPLIFMASRSPLKKAYNYAYLWSNLSSLWKAVSAIYLFRWTEMHRDFAGLMQHLCGCLGIQYDPSLRQATFMGNPGWDSRESKEERLVIRATFKKSRGRC